MSVRIYTDVDAIFLSLAHRHDDRHFDAVIRLPRQRKADRLRLTGGYLNGAGRSKVRCVLIVDRRISKQRSSGISGERIRCERIAVQQFVG